jgi:hypothetical protein
MQKIQKGGSDGNRYMWNVSVKNEGKTTYRSRHATAAGVRSEFKKRGKTVTGVSVVKA